MKIIQIDGFKGLITAAFIGICLFAGFVVFPEWCQCTYGINILLICLCFLCWMFFRVSFYGDYCNYLLYIIQKGLAVSFKESEALSESELDMIMKRQKSTLK